MPKGVYIARTIIYNKIYKSMINNDTHPTLLKLKKTIIWAHLIDFSNFIYEQNIRVEFLSFLREKKKFSSLNELKGQLTKDCISLKKNIWFF